jgi:hypothetical protein
LVIITYKEWQYKTRKIPLKNSDGFYTNVGLIMRKLALYGCRFTAPQYLPGFYDNRSSIPNIYPE